MGVWAAVKLGLSLLGQALTEAKIARAQAEVVQADEIVKRIAARYAESKKDTGLPPEVRAP